MSNKETYISLSLLLILCVSYFLIFYKSDVVKETFTEYTKFVWISKLLTKTHSDLNRFALHEDTQKSETQPIGGPPPTPQPPTPIPTVQPIGRPPPPTPQPPTPQPPTPIPTVQPIGRPQPPTPQPPTPPTPIPIPIPTVQPIGRPPPPTPPTPTPTPTVQPIGGPPPPTPQPPTPPTPTPPTPTPPTPTPQYRYDSKRFNDVVALPVSYSKNKLPLTTLDDVQLESKSIELPPCTDEHIKNIEYVGKTVNGDQIRNENEWERHEWLQPCNVEWKKYTTYENTCSFPDIENKKVEIKQPINCKTVDQCYVLKKECERDVNTTTYKKRNVYTPIPQLSENDRRSCIGVSKPDDTNFDEMTINYTYWNETDNAMITANEYNGIVPCNKSYKKQPIGFMFNDEPVTCDMNVNDISLPSDEYKRGAVCPIHCKVDWVDDGECSVKCGKGTQRQQMNIITHPNETGNACPSETHRDIECDTGIVCNEEVPESRTVTNCIAKESASCIVVNNELKKEGTISESYNIYSITGIETIGPIESQCYINCNTPSPPENLKMTNRSENSITITWDSGDNGDTVISEYKIHYMKTTNENESGFYKKTDNIIQTTQSYTINNLIPNTSYKIFVIKKVIPDYTIPLKSSEIYESTTAIPSRDCEVLSWKDDPTRPGCSVECGWGTKIQLANIKREAIGTGAPCPTEKTVNCFSEVNCPPVIWFTDDTPSIKTRGMNSVTVKFKLNTSGKIRYLILSNDTDLKEQNPFHPSNILIPNAGYGLITFRGDTIERVVPNLAHNKSYTMYTFPFNYQFQAGYIKKLNIPAYQ